MLSAFLSHANYWALLVSALVYFALGSLWFSALFGKIWSAEVAKHGVVIKDPSKKDISSKMLQTFICNVIAVLSIGYLVFVTGTSNWMAGLKLGLLCGIGFATVGIFIAYTWESRSLKLLMIDCGYAIVGMGLAGIILSVWH
jgi:hypothetical protein